MAATQDSQVETLTQMQFQHHFLMRPRSPKISSPPDIIGNISIMELIQEIHGSCLTTTILNGHQDHLNLGIKEGDEATVVSFVDADPAPGTQRNATTYFRTTVELNKPGSYSYFQIRLKYDDAAAIYANGKEIIRTSNLPSNARFDTYATSGTPNERKYYEYQIPSSNFINGINHIAVEIHNSSPASSDISFDMFLEVKLIQVKEIELQI